MPAFAGMTERAILGFLYAFLISYSKSKNAPVLLLQQRQCSTKNAEKELIKNFT
jgi:hypothetical protein